MDISKVLMTNAALGLPVVLTRDGVEYRYISRSNIEARILDTSPTRVTVLDGATLLTSGGNAEAVTLPDSMTVIGAYTFFTSKISTIKLSANLVNIRHYAFGYCHNLKTLRLPECLKVIDEGAFGHSGITKLVLPKSLRHIASNAFVGCADLKELKLPRKFCNPTLELPSQRVRIIPY